MPRVIERSRDAGAFVSNHLTPFFVIDSVYEISIRLFALFVAVFVWRQ